MERDAKGTNGPSRAGSCATALVVALIVLTIAAIFIVWQIEEALRL